MVHNVEIDYPQFVHDAISHNLQYYNMLFEHKVQIIDHMTM